MIKVWKNITFTKFYIASIISSIGTWFDMFALQLIFVNELQATPILLSTLIFFELFPAVILGTFVGGLADKYNKKKLLIYTEFISGIFTIAIYLTHMIPILLSFILIRACITSINIPANVAYLKSIVSEEELLKASTHITSMFQIARVLGPITGAFLLIFFNARLCILINAFSFIVSAIILCSLPADKTSVHDKSKQNWIKDTAAGIKYLWHNPILRKLLLLGFIWFFSSLVRQSQLALFLKHLEPDKKNILGIYMSIDGLGAVLSSMLLNRLNIAMDASSAFLLGFILIASGIFMLAFYQPVYPIYFICLSACTVGLGTGILLVNYNYILKKCTPT